MYAQSMHSFSKAVVKFVQNSYTFNESDGTGLVDIEMVGQVDGTNVTVTVIDNEQGIITDTLY